MKQIGIITLSGYDNYGNRLQNFAMENLFKEYGQVETLFQRSGSNYSPSNKNSFFYNYNLYKEDYSDEELINKIVDSTPDLNYKNLRIKRFIKFKKFSETYLNEIDNEILGNEYISEEICNQYDLLVVGSDQVWNPQWLEHNINCLIPVETKAVKVSYAASFGISPESEMDLSEIKLHLKDFKEISVREFAGLDILSNIGVEKGQLVLDPTMLLAKHEWESYLYPHREKPTVPYIFVYILGETTEEMKNFIETVKRDSKLEVVTVNSYEEEKYYDADPFEFLDYISSAKLVITDSFHGIVFSNIFNTPYVIFERKSNLPSMNSRIETLDKLFNVNSRNATLVNNEKIDEILEQDFRCYNSHIQKYKDKSFNFIKKIFEGIN